MNNFIVGVPYTGCEYKSEIPCVCEEGAMAIATGASLTGKEPIVFMQNSGLGRCVDIITSLLHPYGIEIILRIKYRDTPEHHRFMGNIQDFLLILLEYAEKKSHTEYNKKN